MEPIRVLIVDDEEELVSALRERLELRGFVVRGETSGEAALAALEETPWDVLLADIRMPGIGGFELTRCAKEQHPSTAVVLLTGRSAAGDAEQGLALGARDCLVKPVAIEELTRVLRAAAERESET